MNKFKTTVKKIKVFGVYNSFIFIFFCALFVIAAFSSCSQNAPEINEVNYSVIFEYATPEDEPLSRLSVFVQSASDVRRCDRIVVESLDTGYIWDIDEVLCTEFEQIQWCGNTNLVVPEGRKIPKGDYKVTLYNADEKEACVYLALDYDEDFYSLKKYEAQKKLNTMHADKNVAVYDKQGIILYYGSRSDELKTNRDIWNRFSTAQTYKDVWCTPGRFLMCIMPEENIDNKE